MTPNQPNRKTA